MQLLFLKFQFHETLSECASSNGAQYLNREGEGSQ